MKQRARIFELSEQGLNEIQIENKLKIEFGQQAYCSKTIYKWMGRQKLGYEFDEKGDTPGTKIDDQLLKRIEQCIEENHFASIRSIAQELREDDSTVWRYLTKYLGRVFKHSRWLPHSLNSSQKYTRMIQSNELSEILKDCQKRSWANLMTGDSSWFRFTYSNSGAWLLPEDNSPEMDGSKFDVQKCMVTIIWGIKGFYAIDFLPEGQSLNSEHFVNNILMPVFEKKKSIWSEWGKRKIWLHLDNSKVHNSHYTLQKCDEFLIKRTPQPPYSPDIAPSDFYLFGYIKDRLKGHHFTSLEDLKEKIFEICNSISRDTLKRVFQDWIKRVDWVTLHNGEYYVKE